MNFSVSPSKAQPWGDEGKRKSIRRASRRNNLLHEQGGHALSFLRHSFSGRRKFPMHRDAMLASHPTRRLYIDVTRASQMPAAERKKRKNKKRLEQWAQGTLASINVDSDYRARPASPRSNGAVRLAPSHLPAKPPRNNPFSRMQGP